MSVTKNRAALVKAHQDVRDLKNRIFELEGKLHKVTAERDLLMRDLETAMQKPTREPARLSDAELYALAALVDAEGRQTSPASSRLHSELHARAILRKENPLSEARSLVQRLAVLRGRFAVVGHDDRPGKIVEEIIKLGATL